MANPAAAKLMKARIALQSKELKKSGSNKFAGYSYFELGDFLPTVQQIFADMGLCGVVSFGTDTATLTIVDTDSDSKVEVTSPMSSAALKGCHEVQNLGAVQTYLRRYLWVTAMEIVEHDPLDATTGAAAPEKAAPEVTPERLDELTQMLNACQSMDELGKVFLSLNAAEKKVCTPLKDSLKVKFVSNAPKTGTAKGKAS